MVKIWRKEDLLSELGISTFEFIYFIKWLVDKWLMSLIFILDIQGKMDCLENMHIWYIYIVDMYIKHHFNYGTK